MNIKSILGCVALGLAASLVGTTQAGEPHEAENGDTYMDSTLLHDCQALLTYRKTPRVQVSDLAKQSALACQNYVYAVRDAWLVTEGWSCDRPEMKTDTAQLVVDYLHKHPMDPHELDAIPIVAALREAYPCQDAKKDGEKPK